MKQQTLGGDFVLIDGKTKKYKRWAWCSSCKTKVYDGRKHLCKVDLYTKTFKGMTEKYKKLE